MKKLSLRMRLTLIITLILICICIALTISFMYSATAIFVEPIAAITTSEALHQPFQDEIITVPAAAITQSNNAHVLISEKYSVAAASNTYTNLGIVIMIVLIIIGAVLVYIISGVALKPVKNLSTQIEAINEEDLSVRITNFNASDELQKLANSFNSMIAKLENAFAREKRFTADAAHELKTPIAVIKTNLDVLKISDNADIEEYKETIDIVEKQTDRMINLVGDLFTMFSRYTMEDTIDLAELVQEIQKELSINIEEKNIDFIADVQMCSVKGNSTMLKHAISNIVENAIKYNAVKGSVNVTLKQQEGKCALEISDTGIGIEENLQKSIFEPFYRVDKSRSRAVGGSGLGLAIAKEIIEKHKGSICYKPNNPKGSTFIITLPM